MPTPGHRLERLADQIREEIADMVVKELKDPRIGMVTVTRVQLSGDLRHARILVSVLGNEQQAQKTLEGLSSAAGYLRGEIGRRLRVRRAPELVFVLDHGAEESEKIERLLRNLKPGLGTRDSGSGEE
jgi:ribosome-binding factor A